MNANNNLNSNQTEKDCENSILRTNHKLLRVNNFSHIYGMPTAGKSALVAMLHGINIVDSDVVWNLAGSRVWSILDSKEAQSIDGLRHLMERFSYSIACMVAKHVSKPVITNLTLPPSRIEGKKTVAFIRSAQDLYDIYVKREMEKPEYRKDGSKKLSKVISMEKAENWVRKAEKYVEAYDLVIKLKANEYISDYFGLQFSKDREESGVTKQFSYISNALKELGVPFATPLPRKSDDDSGR